MLDRYPPMIGGVESGAESVASKINWIEIRQAAKQLANNILKAAKRSGAGAGARSGQHGKPYTVAAAQLRGLLRQNQDKWLPEFKKEAEQKISQCENKAR